MWFKNSMVYQFDKQQLPNLQDLEELLQKKYLPSCPNFQPATVGWLPPIAKPNTPLIHNCNGAWLICFAKEERLLPPGVVKEALEEKIHNIQETQARDIYRKEKLRLREDIIASLLPKAFTQKKITYAYFDTKKNWLFIDTSSAKKADEFLACLHESIGTINLQPLTTKNSIKLLMSAWVKTEINPAPFTITEECKLQHAQDDKAIINVRYHDTISGDALSHLKEGYIVTSLLLHWQESLQFALQDNLILKRIAPLNVIQEQIKDMDAPDAETLFDNQFALMSLSLSQLISDLIQLIDGKQKQVKVQNKISIKAGEEILY